MDERWKSDFDGRQFELMETHLHQYEQGLIDLGSLIAGLEALLASLETAPESWKSAFRKHWGVLEDVYAVALYRAEQGEVPSARMVINEPSNRKLIERAIRDIRGLLHDQGAIGRPDSD
jgi:hypothetical protein